MINMQQVLYYKIGFREGGSHIRVRQILGFRGSGFGLRVQGSTNLFSAESASGKEYLSHRGLGVRGEVLGVLEGVLVVSVKEIMSVHGVGLRGDLGVGFSTSHPRGSVGRTYGLRVQVEELVVRGFSGSVIIG